MKLSEKIKKCRKCFGLSQEQLAEILNVSRQAITKWETDGGMPDVTNLKPLADVFGVSVDFLLNEDDENCNPILKETLKIEEKNNFNNRYDYAVKILKERYLEPSKIYGLSQTRKLSKVELATDLIVGPGIVDMIHYLNEFAIWFLVKKENQNLLVKVTKEYMETVEISKTIIDKEFVIDKYKFRLMKEV